MARMATQLIASLLLVSLTTGCAWQRNRAPQLPITALPAENGPQFDLTRDSAPIISTVSHHLEPKVGFTDARPDLEKMYYPGETDAHRWRDAMTIFPLESFQPGFEKSLRQTLIRSLDDAMRFSSIELKMTSFHVALDERERGKQELSEHCEQWEQDQARQREAAEKQHQLNYEDRSAADRVASGLFRAAFVTPLQERKLRQNRRFESSVAPQTLPPSLTANKQPGWNCHLAVDVVLNREDGRTQTIPVLVIVSAPQNDAQPVESRIREVVSLALEDFGNQIRESQP